MKDEIKVTGKMLAAGYREFLRPMPVVKVDARAVDNYLRAVYLAMENARIDEMDIAEATAELEKIDDCEHKWLPAEICDHCLMTRLLATSKRDDAKCRNSPSKN